MPERLPGVTTRNGFRPAVRSLTQGVLLIRITNMNPSRGRISCTFTATVGELMLPGCALIRRADGNDLLVPRIGVPGDTRQVPLSAVMEAELLRVAVAHYKEKI